MAKAKATAADFGATASKAGTAWSASGKKMQSAGREISQAGSLMNRRVTLPLLALGAGSIKTAIDFETAFTGVRKTIDATEAQYRELEDGIQSLAERLPASVEEISAVAEAAGQLGVERESILGFTKVMIDLGESTNLTADMAATSLARLANITKMPQTEFDRLGATIVDLGNKGASTEAEITEMALRIAGAGSTVGMTEAQILGFAESLSSVGIRAEAGGSSISKVFIEMANAAASGGKDLRNFAKVAGVSGDEFKAAFEKDAAGAAITFIEGLGRMRKEGVNVFQVLDKLGLSEIRVRDALLRASGATDLFRQSQVNANNAWRENSALTDEANKRYETNAAKLEILKNKFRNIMATFGNDMMPILQDAANALADLAEWFGKLDPEMRKNILKWGAIAIAAGPFVRVLGSITTLLGGIMRLGGGAARVLGKVAAGGAATSAASTVGTAAGGAATAASAGATAVGVGAGTAVAGVAVAGAAAYYTWTKALKAKTAADYAHMESLNSSHALMVEYFHAVQAGRMTIEDFEQKVYQLITAEGMAGSESMELARNAETLRNALSRAASMAATAKGSVNALEHALNSLPTNKVITITTRHNLVTSGATSGATIRAESAGATAVSPGDGERFTAARVVAPRFGGGQVAVGSTYNMKFDVYADSTTDGRKLAREIRAEIRRVQDAENSDRRARTGW